MIWVSTYSGMEAATYRLGNMENRNVFVFMGCFLPSTRQSGEVGLIRVNLMFLL